MRTLALLASATFTISLTAAEPAVPTKADVEAMITKAQTFILAQQQPNGAFSPGEKFILGITAMATDSLAKPPVALDGKDPRIVKALTLLKSFKQPDGGIYDPTEGLGSYVTSLSMMAFVSTKEADTAFINGGRDYLFGLQNNDHGSIFYGGIGYGSRGKGTEDISNTGFAVQALVGAGVPATDPHMQKALAFLERCQDLSSVNKLPWVQNTGGAVYTPDESKAEGSWNPDNAKPGDPPPKLLPYGSVTYQLISSYLTLDLKPGDPRVKAALGWVTQNYRFDGNPGMLPGKERQGLYYYYAAMARTFDLMDATTLDVKGGKVDWRADFFKAISAEAKPTKLDDGSAAIYWENSEKRWGESMPTLVTTYMIRSLKHLHSTL